MIPRHLALQSTHKEMPVLEVKFLGEEACEACKFQFGTIEVEGSLDHPGEICAWRYGSYGSNIISCLNPMTYLFILCIVVPSLFPFHG